MRHRKMLITAIVLIAVGFILWQILCPIAMLYGIGSYKTGWWIFSEDNYLNRRRYGKLIPVCKWTVRQLDMKQKRETVEVP